MSVRATVKGIQDIMRQDVGVDGDAQRISQLCWMFFLKILDDQDQEFELMQRGYTSPLPVDLRWGAWAAHPEGMTGNTLLDFINDELFPSLKELPIVGANKHRRRVVRSVFEDAYNYMKSGYLLRQVVNKINEVDFNNLAERQHFGDVYEQVLNDLQNAGNAGEYYTPRAVTAFMADRIDPKPGEILLDPACGTGGFLTCAMRHMRDRYIKTPQAAGLLRQPLRAVAKKPLPPVFRPYASIGTNLLFFEKGTPTETIWFYEHRVPEGQKAYSMTKPIRVEHLAPCVAWWGGASRKGRVETCLLYTSDAA